MLEQQAALVGTKFCGAAAINALGRLRVGDYVRLVREADNRHDGNAVQCWAFGTRLGFVSRIANPPIARAMDSGAAVEAIVVTEPEIIGGRVRREPLLAVRWDAADA